MKGIILVMVLSSVQACRFVATGSQLIVRMPDKASSLDEARETCSNIGAKLPFAFNATTMKEISSLLASHSDDRSWLDVVRDGDDYVWKESQLPILAQLWYPTEPRGDGLVIFFRDFIVEDKYGLCVHSGDLSLGSPSVLCQFNVTNKEDIKTVHRMAETLPQEEWEQLEVILIESQLSSEGLNMTAIEKRVEEQDKKTNTLKRLIQKMIENRGVY